MDRNVPWGRLPRLSLVLVLSFAMFLPLVLSAGAQGSVNLAFNKLESAGDGSLRAYVTAQDENGVPLHDLSAGSFAIIEDGQNSFAPDSVATEVNNDAPLGVALIVDLSGNMAGQALADTKAAAQNMLQSLLSGPSDQDSAAFFGISGPVNVKDLTIHPEAQEVGFTHDRDTILKLVSGLSTSSQQQTPLYDALWRVVKITGGQPKPRAIIVISDGADKVSKFSADDPISEANRNSIPIFPIGYSKGTIDDAYLTRLASRTGGAYTRAPDAAQFGQIFQDTLNNLKQQYVLTYHTRLNKDGGSHNVVVQVNTPKGKAGDQKVFKFSAVPTVAPEAAPAAGAATSAEAPGSAVEGSVTPAPASASTDSLAGLPAHVLDYVKDSKNLPVVLGAIGALMAVLAVVLFLLLRGGRSVPEPEVGLPPPPYPGGPAARGGGADERAPTVLSARPVISAGLPNIAGEPGSATNVPTQPARAAGAAAVGVLQPSPYAAPPPQPDESGHTVIVPRGPAWPTAMALLVARNKPQARYDVQSSTAIGREQGNQVLLQNPTISRQHAIIKQEGEQFRLFDLASANGTFVNENRVTDPVLLNDGDIVRLGELEFIFKRIV